jgi:hypothetical protein
VSAPERWDATPFSEQRQALLIHQGLQGPAFCRALAGLVVDHGGHKLTDPGRIRELERSVLSELSRLGT